MSEREKEIEAVAARIVAKLSEQGRLIEGGWQALRILTIPPSAPAIQVTEMRRAFFAGAQHLFASMMTILDKGPDAEPTEKDLRRVSLIHSELEAFAEELGVSLGLAPKHPPSGEQH